MEPFGEAFAFLAGVPAVAGLLLTAATILVTSDWRLSLSAMLLQYVLLGLILTRFVPVEVALVRILTGSLVVPILYLTGRRVQEARQIERTAAEGPRFLGLPMGWGAGPLGLPLRLLTVLLVVLAVVRFFPDYPALLPPTLGDSPGVPADVALVAFWLAAMGMVGVALSGEALRVAPAVLTIMAGFDLVYAGLEGNLAIAGLWATLTLLAALAFSYLAAVQGLGPGPSSSDEEGAGT